MFEEWLGKLPLYLGFFLTTLQFVVDSLLDLTVGYTTRGGWRKEREDAKTKFEKSAQLVMIDCKEMIVLLTHHKG